MDIATLIGIFSGLLLVFIAVFSGTGAGTFINGSAIIIVLGGTLAATFANFPLKEVVSVFTVIRNAFMNTAPVFRELMITLVDMSRKARREGILVLESVIAETDDDFLRKSVQLAVDGTEPRVMRGILEAEIANQEDRHRLGRSIMKAMGAYAPAFGMIGTLIGLIQMLQTLQDPTEIGGGMAVALVTTFYGTLLANLFFLPIAGKLAALSAQEISQKEMMLEGVLSIQLGENPRLIEERLNSFIPPKIRQTLAAEPREESHG